MKLTHLGRVEPARLGRGRTASLQLEVENALRPNLHTATSRDLNISVANVPAGDCNFIPGHNWGY